MGFGSYDESEQDKHEFDADVDDDEGITTNEHTHNGAIEFENGASNEELLSRLQEIKGDE